MSPLRAVIVLIVLLVVGYAAAYFILSGYRFTWPPPQQLALPGMPYQTAQAPAKQTSAPTKTASNPPPVSTPATTVPRTPAPDTSGTPHSSSTTPADGTTGTSPDAGGGSPAPEPPADAASNTPAPTVSGPPCPEAPAVNAQAFVAGQDAWYCAPGHLTTGSGGGAADAAIWAPSMRFPIDAPPAYANSQVWGIGGTNGANPNGFQGDVKNYSYPWRDDFCETRHYTTVMCPAGKGHQGQDIRPAHCCDKQFHDKFRVDAAEDGTITSIGSYTVYLAADSGRLYRYLHMDMAALTGLGIVEGAKVKRGQQIGWLSNSFGGSATTFHLHFEIKEAVHDGTHNSFTWVPPYPSLVASYTKLLDGTDKPGAP